jgi:beta-glucosidase
VLPLTYVRANVFPAAILADGRILFESGYPLGEGAIPELYVHDPDRLPDMPVMELKRFDRLSLGPGQTSVVKFVIDRKTFAHYHPRNGKWVTHPGKYEVLIGSSSRDIKLRGSLKVE